MVLVKHTGAEQVLQRAEHMGNTEHESNTLTFRIKPERHRFCGQDMQKCSIIIITIITNKFDNVNYFSVGVAGGRSLLNSDDSKCTYKKLNNCNLSWFSLIRFLFMEIAK